MHQSNKETINSINFNPDNTFAAVATSKGFKIFSTQPFKLKFQRDFGTPLEIVELINRSNLIGIVGQKQTPFTPPNRLAIFDDNTQKIIADINFQSTIKQVRIRQNKIVVALFNKIFLIDLFNLEIEHIIETFKFEENQKYNLCSLSNDYGNLILAAPGIETGHVMLVYLNRLTERKIKAHQSILSAVLLTSNGEKLATTSEKGIQIRIFDTKTGENIQEVRRGNEFATIYSIAFNRDGNWLAVSSDSCNLHVFVIKPSPTEKERQYLKVAEGEGVQNPRSWLFFMKSIFPYFDAEYSYSHHIYEEYTPEMRTALAFGLHDDHIISLSNLETFEKIEINAKGGKCRLVEKIANILQRDQPNQ